MTKEETESIVKSELADLDKCAMDVKRANTWQQNDSLLNSTLNVGAITDIDGDDVTQLCFDDLYDNYGIVDDSIAENDIESAIRDDKNMNDTDALADDKKSYQSWRDNVSSLDWAEDTGFHHETNNYYTNVSTSSVINWIKDMKQIIKGDLDAVAEA